MLHKPAGVVTAVRDHHDQTVLDLLGTSGKRSFPVGRLTRTPRGFCLITNDAGVLAHRSASPVLRAKDLSRAYEEAGDEPDVRKAGSRR